MLEGYSKFDKETLILWKEGGVKYIRLELLNTGSPYWATVKVHPNFNILTRALSILINSEELIEYATYEGVVVTYIVKQNSVARISKSQQKLY